MNIYTYISIHKNIYPEVSSDVHLCRARAPFCGQQSRLVATLEVKDWREDTAEQRGAVLRAEYDCVLRQCLQKRNANEQNVLGVRVRVNPKSGYM